MFPAVVEMENFRYLSEEHRVATRAESLQEETGCSFEEEWPEIARRLERFLAAKGVDEWVRADVIQEAAARVYPRWDTLDHSLPLWNLVVTIALRILHNHHRKESRIDLVPDPVPIHKDDVHLRGLHRAQLHKARSAMLHLTDDQRRVLLAELGEALLPTGSGNRIKVLRLRARTRLRDALGPWAPSAITVRFRYLRARIGQKSSTLEMHAPAMAGALVNIAIAATLALAGAAVETENAAVDTANFVQPQRAQLLSSADLRDTGPDPKVNIQRPGRPALSRAKDRAKEEASGLPYVLANTRENTQRLAQVAQDRGEYAKERAQDQAEDKNELAEERTEYAKERAQDHAEHNKAWIKDKLP